MSPSRAEAEVDINRARLARLKLFREPEARSTSRAVADPERTERRICEMLRELEAIKRYENRARGWRQRAIHALDARRRQMLTAQIAAAKARSAAVSRPRPACAGNRTETGLIRSPRRRLRVVPAER
jgi:hypothetical protein